MNKESIYGLTFDQLSQWLLERGHKKFRATQVWDWLYVKRVFDFSEMSNLNKDLVALLEEHFYMGSMSLNTKQESSDGTVKFLFNLKDGNLIETVLMRQSYGYSVCVTTQAGCNMGCAFCASGQIKKKRDLEPFEMVLQVLQIDDELKKEDKRVSHIVIMGIGEPFDNYDNVIEFIRIVNDPKGLEIGSRHITVSTCGIVPKIYDFSELPLQVNLAISLHFANDLKRSKYMKINKKYDLKSLFEALNHYYKKTNRRITFEYILLDGINDDVEDARQLVQLIRGMNCYVNLIPYNATGLFNRTNQKKADIFFDYLMKNKINVTMRKEQGHDIDAACGQLRLKEIECRD